jgi:hypothetical protein
MQRISIKVFGGLVSICLGVLIGACSGGTIVEEIPNCKIVSSCEGGDGCCPAGCTSANDGDCSEEDVWLCDPAYYGDGECDCGCGIPDSDCVGGGCTTTGCFDEECVHCFAENTEQSIDCPPDPNGDPTCDDGIQNQDETGVDCGGSCPPCWSGTGGEVCLSCPDDCSCSSDEYCFQGVCLLSVSGNTYFVAPDGNDDHAGTFENPFRTWQKAFDVIAAGDIAYLRGGVYMVPADNRGGYELDTSGTPADRVIIANYPGEKPILDFSDVLEGDLYNSTQFYGLFINADYITIRGLTVRNLWQKDGEDEINGAFSLGGCYDVIIENCVAHDVGGRGFRVGSSDEVYFINCDAYHCVDYLTAALPGNDGTGFGDYNWDVPENRVYFRGCRAWNCGDQGFSSAALSYSEYDGCWSFNNGVLEGEGHGFKMGWVWEVFIPGTLNRLYKNNIAADNRAQGFTTNDNDYECGEMNVYNNFSYHNGHHDWHIPAYGYFVYDGPSSADQEMLRVFKNNLAYDNEAGDIAIGNGTASYTHENNSWDLSVSVDENDFESLDVSQLQGPRKPNGDLPDITFGRLRCNSSDLKNAGVDLGLPFHGSAPDLGAFECAE